MNHTMILIAVLYNICTRTSRFWCNFHLTIDLTAAPVSVIENNITKTHCFCRKHALHGCAHISTDVLIETKNLAEDGVYQICKLYNLRITSPVLVLEGVKISLHTAPLLKIFADPHVSTFDDCTFFLQARLK